MQHGRGSMYMHTTLSVELFARAPEHFPIAQGSQAMVDGLWQGPTALTLDYVNVVRRIKLLGFNAVRLPFSVQVTVARRRLACLCTSR